MKYPLDYGRMLHINLVEQVKKTRFVLNLVKTGKLNCALINPKYIIDIFQIVVAANIVARADEHDLLLTNGVHSELMYYLSPSKNITIAIKDFGVTESHNCFIVCVIGKNTPDDLRKVNEIFSEIRGVFKLPSEQELSKHTDRKSLIEKFKITREELKVSNLLDSVVTKMACKDVLK